MELTVPGDKSLSHRAIMFASLAQGESRVSGVLPGADPRATAEVFRRLGVAVPEVPADGSELRIRGVGLRGLKEPDEVLDCGNSGTTARLLLGILAGQELAATVDGDASLRGRPMSRVTDPLNDMGAAFRWQGDRGRLPVAVRGGRLGSLEYRMPVASAQVKSALLLAGITGGAPVSLVEPGRSRDHSERLLGAMGVTLSQGPDGRDGWRVELGDPPEALDPVDFAVPGDFSSAAFFVALGVLGGAGPELVLPGVGVNPTRTGLLSALERMGARVTLDNLRDAGGEPVADLVVAPSDLRGVEVGSDEIPALLDEVPVLAVLAARARGETRITGARELRVKESDRLAALASNLRGLGADVDELEDGLVIRGSRDPLKGTAATFHDHRIAMAFGVLGALDECDIDVEDPGVVDVSYPGFWRDLARVSSGGGP